jgi:hypothetical protein
MAKDDKGLAKRVSALEREVKGLTKEMPVPPEQQANMRAAMAREAGPGDKMDYLTVRPGNANFEGPVREHMAALKGRSRNDVAADNERGAGSPLGRGSHSKSEERRRK